MKKYLSIIFGALLMGSCMDMELLPNDKTVDEDFWQSKSDVALMVNGAYKQFASSNVQQRLIVWGGFRSDELLLNTGVPATDGTYIALNQIQEVNIETTNTFADWSSLYTVINYCNIVMSKAAAVMDIDPSYTEGDYLTDRSQMLALRALCYYYLVRTFRDVPYTTTAYMTSSQPMVINQLPPTEVLDYCIADLQEAEKNALSSQMSGWKRVGWITKDAIQSILADIYLWRGSVLHSDADYQACIDYCDKVIASKKSQQDQTDITAQKLDYPLTMGGRAFSDLYISQNSDESIFEVQYNTNSASTNEAIAKMYYEYKKDGKSPYLQASLNFGSIKNSSAGNATDAIYINQYDARYWNNCIGVGSGTATSFDIYKYTHTNIVYNSGTPPTKGSTSRPNRTFDRYDQNFIIYRLADILLMKAEALVAKVNNQTGTTSGETTGDESGVSDANAEALTEALELVNQVYKRSLDETQWSASLYNSSYAQDGAKMEGLVLQERLRELCFEGKRWYDLLRYNYRHQDTPCNYATMLVDQGSYMKNYQDFLDIVGRKYDNGSARTNKMKEEPRLYLPVPHSDILTCKPWLRQNPMYTDED
ncbi:MAG: RagB/SusD family nutrient uptake outer membrane protein [Prevotella sp.]